MIELKQENPAPILNEILLQVIQLNENIVRQNALIIQSLTLPALIVKGDEKNNG